MNITKLIPWDFKIKSRYWIKKGKEIDKSLFYKAESQLNFLEAELD